MERAKFNFIASLLFDYPKTDDYIKQRVEEITYPYNPKADSNIGGGRSNIANKPVEKLALNLATDRRLTALENNKRIIDECLDESDGDTAKIIEEVYFHKSKTIEGVAMELPLSPSQARRKRQYFFQAVSDRLGL